MFTSEAYTLQENTTIDVQIITAGELVVKAQYTCSMKVNTNWYWNQQPKHHIIKVPTRKIIHPQLEVNAVTYLHTVTTRLCTRKKANKSISIQPICLSDSDYDYILEEIGRRDKIEFERDVEVYSADEEN